MKLKKYILKPINALMLALIGILGFSSACDVIYTVEYGCPHADFKISGTVKNSETQTAIPNIYIGYPGFYSDSIRSDANGNFQITINDFPQDAEFLLEFIDLDGQQNGLMTNLDTVIKFENPVFVNGDGNWYSGETSKEIEIHLKPKTE